MYFTRKNEFHMKFSRADADAKLKMLSENARVEKKGT